MVRVGTAVSKAVGEAMGEAVVVVVVGAVVVDRLCSGKDLLEPRSLHQLLGPPGSLLEQRWVTWPGKMHTCTNGAYLYFNVRLGFFFIPFN